MLAVHDPALRAQLEGFHAEAARAALEAPLS